jgi:preprotein translocase subunit SecE
MDEALGGINSIFMQFIDYLRDTKAELRHVSWPTQKQAINYTIIVLIISIGTGVFLGILDFGFAEILKRFI